MSSRHICTLIAAALMMSAFTAASAQNKAPRPFAKGVVKTISPSINVGDTFTPPMPLPGVNAKEYQLSNRPDSKTLHAQTRNIFLFKGTWQLEFQILGLRQMNAMIPTANGPVKRNVWYLVYRVRNVGHNVTYKEVTDPKFGYKDHQLQKDTDAIKAESLPNRFFPKFVLEGWVQDKSSKQYSPVKYLDTILPTVVDEIQVEEDPNRELLDSIEISRKTLKVEKSDNDGGVWGVAVFTGVDPNIDYVSVYVSGLTNAYRIQKNSKGENELKRKVLQLNFWRPGDDRREPADKINYGIPLVDDPKEQVNITRFYNLPGPLLRVYEFDKTNDRYTFVTQADSDVDTADFASKAVPILNAGKLTDAVKAALKAVGHDVGSPALERKVDSVIWEFTADVNGQSKSYEIRFEPQFWERHRKGIRFIRSLDHIWIYR